MSDGDKREKGMVEPIQIMEVDIGELEQARVASIVPAERTQETKVINVTSMGRVDKVRNLEAEKPQRATVMQGPQRQSSRKIAAIAQQQHSRRSVLSAAHSISQRVMYPEADSVVELKDSAGSITSVATEIEHPRGSKKSIKDRFKGIADKIFGCAQRLGEKNKTRYTKNPICNVTIAPVVQRGGAERGGKLGR